MISWGQYNLQDANASNIEEFIFLHDFINIILLVIILFVIILMIRMILNKQINKNLLESQTIEAVWTIIPIIILVQIAIPSLLLLYILDESIDTSLTIKVIGHQWFWRYEYSDFWYYRGNELEFNAYIIPREELDQNFFRLLDVDNRIVVPHSVHVRILVSSFDVLHSWTVPRLGVKVDAVPGRINQLKFIALRPGIFYGQCSEICGANHRFIPITIECINPSTFLNWILISMET